MEEKNNVWLIFLWPFTMILKRFVEGYCTSLLQTVDSVIDELLEEGIRLKSRSQFHSENGIVEEEIFPTSDPS